ncbi:hypothetical protein X769_21445 [Mesorhizobium sp. LSJC268A00]|nr:hypothetical protein X769_21445 [Mesorhizobium sp. LSJC268A00]ESZ17789.1 hypothetical protein X735_12500 [Mesorhizobium sp. L2C085B000]
MTEEWDVPTVFGTDAKVVNSIQRAALRLTR